LCLKTFLETLFGKAKLDASLLPKDLAEAYIYCVQFIPINYAPKLKDLVRLFALGLGALCRTGQKGIDAFIPVFVGEKDAPLTEENMSVVVFQFKNFPSGRNPPDRIEPYEDSLKNAGMLEGLKRNYLSVFMQLGGDASVIVERAPKRTKSTRHGLYNGVDPNQTQICARGLCSGVYPFLGENFGESDSKKVIQVLNDIATANVEFRRLATKEGLWEDIVQLCRCEEEEIV